MGRIAQQVNQQAKPLGLEIVDVRIKRKDGTVRTVLWNSATLFSPGTRQVMATIAQGQDITERKKAEEDVRAYAEELNRSNAELQQFAYVASHDLQEPLRKIESFSSLLASRAGPALDASGRDYLERMVQATLRMRRMVTDLLALSRVTTQGRPFQQVDLSQVVRAALDDLNGRIQETGAQVEAGELVGPGRAPERGRPGVVGARAHLPGRAAHLAQDAGLARPGGRPGATCPQAFA